VPATAQLEVSVAGQAVRVGIIGCGSVMQGAYMTQLDHLRGRGLVEVVAACDRNESRRALVQEAFRIPRFTTDATDVLEADDVDLVVVLTSIPSHGELAARALARGKHVLVEKPMSTNLDEAARLLELAEEGPGYLLCAPHVVLSTTFGTMWRRLREGQIGRVSLARARYGWAGPTWNEWFYRHGGGALFDMAIYNITSLTGLLGPVRRVVAMSGVAIPERRVGGTAVSVQAEDNAQVLLDFGDSTLGVITTGFTMQQYRSPAIELYGSKGTLQMLGDDWAPQGEELWTDDVGAWRYFKDIDPAWPWTDGLRHLVECIRSGTPPLVSPEHAYHALEVVLRAREASESGQVQDVRSTFGPLAYPPAADEPVHLMHDLRR
jgi:predicted dehydrogenase